MLIMKKYLLMSSLILGMTVEAQALTAEQQLDAMRDIFLKEFQKMDTNQDGQLNKQEYLSYQFENMRANIIEAEGFKFEEDLKEDPKAEEPAPEVKAEDTAPAPEVKEESAPETPAEPEKTADTAASENVEPAGIPTALNDMANFELNSVKSTDVEIKEPLTMEDVMPKENINPEDAPEIDLSVSEDESLKNILEDMDKQKGVMLQDNPEEAVVEDIKTDELSSMMESIRQTLPKKIDDITTWTNIDYSDKTINYIYKADIDTSSYTDTDKEALRQSIKDEACQKAYTDMCPKIKPMFIDKGINMKIRYFDKNDQELNFCEFNAETCQ